MEQEINIHNGSNQINPAATVVQNNYIVQQGQQFPLPNLALGNSDTDNKVLPSCSDEVILLRRNFSFDEINRKILESEEVIIFGLGCTITTKLMYDKYISQELFPPSMKILFMDFKGDAVKVAAKREGEPVSKLKTRYKDNWLLVQNLIEKHSSKIRAKKIDYLPPYNLFIFNPNHEDSEIYVHIAGWKSASTDGRPLIVFNKKYHLYWFEYFLSEFNKMWNTGVPLAIDDAR